MLPGCGPSIVHINERRTYLGLPQRGTRGMGAWDAKHGIRTGYYLAA